MSREQCRVDLHPMRLDADGNGAQARDGGGSFHHLALERTTGTIGGRSVVIATAARLKELRQGYEPRPQDVHDLSLLDSR
jgi:lincosamide nucleotidyltransferase A/C/D/E